MADLLREVEKHKRRYKYAWAKFYEQIEMNVDNARDNHIVITNVIQNSNTIPQHIITELEEQAEQLRKQFECPVCLEPIEKGKLKVSFCGHKYCEVCFPQLTNCAICRKNFRR